MKYLWIFSIISLFISCKKEVSYQEKICSKYIGKELIQLSPEKLINKNFIDCKQQGEYKLIHTLELTCCSCIAVINENVEFFKALNEFQVLFEIIGYSSYNEESFSPILLQYPFYFDFYREFSFANKLIYDESFLNSLTNNLL